MFFFFFNDTATTEIYTLSLHDALPISPSPSVRRLRVEIPGRHARRCRSRTSRRQYFEPGRSEEHTSELQSRSDLVCRLLLEKKKNNTQSKNQTSELANIQSLAHPVTVT